MAKPRPVKRLEVYVQQQLEEAITRNKPQGGKSFPSQNIERSMIALGVDARFVAKLLAANPEPDIEAMTRTEIEEWMRAGLPVASQMPNRLLEGHVSRLLSQLVADSEEIKILSTDLEFMATLARLSPGLSIFSLNPVGRAFVLCIAKTMGLEASDEELVSAVLSYREIAEKLQLVIDYEGISFALQDPEINWIEFFNEIIGDLTA
jgi:hypothetical protein